MSIERYKLGEYVPATGGGGDTGDKFSFKSIPDRKGDEFLYVRRISIRTRLPSIVVGSGKTMAEGELLKLFSNIQIDVPGVGTIFKLTGLDTHRLYRARHGHVATDSPAAATSTTATREWLHVIEFSHPNDMKKHNGVIPVATLQRATFKAYLRAITDTTLFSANDVVTAFGTDGLIEAYAECVRLKERRIPTLFVQDYEEVAAQKSPKYEAGRYVEALLVPAADAAWTTADYTTITANFGDVAHQPEATQQRNIIREFNSWLRDQQAGSAGVGRVVPPVDGSGTVHDFIPVLQLAPPGGSGEGAKFLSSERVDASAQPQLVFDATPTKGPKLIRTRIADPGSWQDAIRRDLGFVPGSKLRPKLASKFMTSNVDTLAISPKKVTTEG